MLKKYKITYRAVLKHRTIEICILQIRCKAEVLQDLSELRNNQGGGGGR